ncbi:MAG: OmpA family protein [Candidatus Omnitrophota bacterium]
MRFKKYSVLCIGLLIVSSLAMSGCAVNFYKQSPQSRKKISDLKARISDLEKQRMEERERFEEVKRALDKKFRDQVSDNQMSFEVTDRGLVIILSDDILFDSGKTEIKEKAFPVLNKVSEIIREKVPDKNIGVGGHTDNVPIKHSKWASNWELSTARATNVLYYLEKQGVSPSKLSATGYGEHRPVASNDTIQGRAKNRRVEIVILPEFVEKRQEDVTESIK